MKGMARGGEILAALVLALAGIAAAEGAGDGEWAYWGGDERSSRYSPLTQIDASNFGSLQVMWRWKAANFGPEPDPVYRATPIYANGKLYTVAGYRRTVVCIDPATGETLWMFREKDGPRWAASTRKNYGKGVAFALVGGRPVVYVATPAYYLWALDADTGQPLPFFGNNGVVDLHLGLGPYSVDPDRGALDWGDITTSSAPIVVNGVVVVGGAHDRGYYPENRENIPGIVRGYDARTGRMLWRFDPVPKPGQPFNDTWEDGSWKYTGNVSPWAPLSADSKLGLVYVPTDTPTNDYYGGSRHGKNVYGTSLLALEVKTGALKWFFQLVHHDIWNMDLPDAPHPIDLTIDGRRVPAIVQATKQGWLYVFNRETGEPVWPIEERPVPQSDVPFEKTWPTQPFVTKPPPFEQQGITERRPHRLHTRAPRRGPAHRAAVPHGSASSARPRSGRRRTARRGRSWSRARTAARTSRAARWSIPRRAGSTSPRSTATKRSRSSPPARGTRTARRGRAGAARTEASPRST